MSDDLSNGLIGKNNLDKIGPLREIWLNRFLSHLVDFIQKKRNRFMTCWHSEASIKCHVQQISWPPKYYRRIEFNFLFFFSSAGVGRTGVLIFMETAFNMIEGAEPIFPLEIVRKMRDQRCSLIQTPVSGQFDDSYMTYAFNVMIPFFFSL